MAGGWWDTGMFKVDQLHHWSDAIENYSEPWICEVCNRPSCEGTHMVDPRPVRVESKLAQLTMDIEELFSGRT